MAKSCSICEDPRRDEFDRRARIETNIAKIAQDFALSYDAFYRHVKANHHIREVTAIPTSAELATSESIYKEIEKWHTEAKDLQQRRFELLESIAEAADEIKRIDNRLTVLKSQELEKILIQSEPGVRA